MKHLVLLGTRTLSFTLSMNLLGLLSRKKGRSTGNGSLHRSKRKNVKKLIPTKFNKKKTYGTEIGSVLATSNQVGDRLGSLTTGLGNDNSVDRLLGGVLLVGLAGGNTDTTSSRENRDSLN